MICRDHDEAAQLVQQLEGLLINEHGWTKEELSGSAALAKQLPVEFGDREVATLEGKAKGQNTSDVPVKGGRRATTNTGLLLNCFERRCLCLFL